MLRTVLFTQDGSKLGTMEKNVKAYVRKTSQGGMTRHGKKKKKNTSKLTILGGICKTKRCYSLQMSIGEELAQSGGGMWNTLLGNAGVRTKSEARKERGGGGGKSTPRRKGNPQQGGFHVKGAFKKKERRTAL